MAKFQVGDLVVLKSGSMRMCVESVDDEGVATVWCNEGVIGRDRFDPVLLNKWEQREDRGGDRPQGGRNFGGDRDRGPRSGDRDGPPNRGFRDDGPPRKQGWDGKPRDKKYYRKDD